MATVLGGGGGGAFAHGLAEAADATSALDEEDPAVADWVVAGGGCVGRVASSAASSGVSVLSPLLAAAAATRRSSRSTNWCSSDHLVSAVCKTVLSSCRLPASCP